MTWDAASAALKQRIRDTWSTTPVAWPNEAFAKPLDDTGRPLPWMLVEIRWADGEQASLGDTDDVLKRRFGHLWVHAFVRAGDGADIAQQYTAQLAALLECRDLGGGLTTEAAAPGGADAGDDDGLYWRESASIPFQYDEG